MRSDTLLCFPFEVQEVGAGLGCSILGFAPGKTLCLGTRGIWDKGEFCRYNGFGGTCGLGLAAERSARALPFIPWASVAVLLVVQGRVTFAQVLLPGYAFCLDREIGQM